jgi:hypothetical protein
MESFQVKILIHSSVYRRTIENDIYSQYRQDLATLVFSLDPSCKSCANQHFASLAKSNRKNL